MGGHVLVSRVAATVEPASHPFSFKLIHFTGNSVHSTLIALSVFGCLVLAVLLGGLLRRHLPEQRLDSDRKETVKLAMGLVATMSALVLGLLVSSAKGTYDTCRMEVVQIAAKVAYLDRMLEVYGEESIETRILFRKGVEDLITRVWSGSRDSHVAFSPGANTGNAIYAMLESLAPQDEKQGTIKSQALTLAANLGQEIALLRMQSLPSISLTMLFVVVSWLFMIFFSFAYISPAGHTGTIALMASALSVSGAIFLTLELDAPFVDFISVSSEPMLQALSHLVPRP